MHMSKLLLLLSSAFVLTSCASLPQKSSPTTPSAAIKVKADPAPDILAKVCAVVKPVYYSRQDTQVTQTQIRELNAGIVALCPQYEPKKK